MMKKVMMLFGLLVLMIAPMFGQAVEPPTDWVDLLAQMPTWFGTLAGFGAVTVFLGSVVTSLFKLEKPWVKQIVSWIVAVALCAVGNLVNFGLLADASWLQTLAYGLGAGLIANGIFDFTVVQLILQYLKLEVKKPV